MKRLREQITRFLSPGALVILTVAVISSSIVVTLQQETLTGIPVWVSAKAHYEGYDSLEADWNQAHPAKQRFNITLLNAVALERRMLAGFLAGTPVADMMETHLGIAAKAFLGPVKNIGFVDLTERLHREGIYDRINTPSFAPYTSRGHIFGLPHDVHPVLLTYRSDLVEAAGIDVSGIETWADYFRVMSPLMQDFDGDGRPDRYLLNAWDTRGDVAIMLILQAGGRLFDQNDYPTVNDPINAEVLARLVTWITGPKRVCIDVPTNTSSGYRQLLDGVVIGTMTPDWMVGTWKLENPRLGGKLKLMPLPAWEKGGRRTSVAGGTMIGIAKTSQNIDLSWQFAKYLYLSPKLAEHMFRTTSIISPVKTLWSQPFYDEPDPYFSGQPSGRMFIQQAPDVPPRSSSPYTTDAGERVTSALIDLRAYADRNGIYDETRLRLEAQRLLDRQEASLKRLIGRNQFLGTK